MSLDIHLISKGMLTYSDGSTGQVEIENWSGNITHNLGKMADEANIYELIWYPDENNITHANQIIKPLEEGLALLKSDPVRFMAFDATNRWGIYEDFVQFIEDYLDACKKNPHAEIEVSR